MIQSMHLPFQFVILGIATLFILFQNSMKDGVKIREWVLTASNPSCSP
jgi:hypothetical protein